VRIPCGSLTGPCASLAGQSRGGEMADPPILDANLPTWGMGDGLGSHLAAPPPTQGIIVFDLFLLN
jgi:hypothetical protein